MPASAGTPFTMELWLPVVGWEGYYEVSDQGRVQSVSRLVNSGEGRQRLATGKIRSLYCEMNKSGDKVQRVGVSLKRDGVVTSVWVGALVLRAFVGEPPEGMECCHDDGDPQNNYLENLRWDTHIENAQDMVRHGRANGPRNPARGRNQALANDLTDDDVRCIRAEPEFRGVCHMLAKIFDVKYLVIWRIRAGLTWMHVPQYL